MKKAEAFIKQATFFYNVNMLASVSLLFWQGLVLLNGDDDLLRPTSEQNSRTAYGRRDLYSLAMSLIRR